MNITLRIYNFYDPLTDVETIFFFKTTTKSIKRIEWKVRLKKLWRIDRLQNFREYSGKMGCSEIIQGFCREHCTSFYTCVVRAIFKHFAINTWRINFSLSPSAIPFLIFLLSRTHCIFTDWNSIEIENIIASLRWLARIVKKWWKLVV